MVRGGMSAVGHGAGGVPHGFRRVMHVGGKALSGPIGSEHGLDMHSNLDTI